MFWNGQAWVDDPANPSSNATPDPTSNGPTRPNHGWWARGLTLLIAIALVVPVLGSRAVLDLGLAATRSVTVEAKADAQVRSFFPDRNYGDAIRLRSRAKAGDQQESLIRFKLPKLTGAVRSARLRLYVRERSSSGGAVRLVTGSWSEPSVTWATRPTLGGTTIGRIGSTGKAGRWTSVNLKLSGLTSGQTVDLAIVGAGTDGAWYASRETGNGPQLVLAVEAAPASGGSGGGSGTPTPEPTASPAATDGPTATPGGTSAPTSAPTATPTNAPTSAPTSAPTTAPTSRPPSGSVAVPASIDATGATNVSAALNSFVASVPNGSTITFKPGGVYRLDSALKLGNRHNLTFDGQGATLKGGGSGGTASSSLFWVGSQGGASTGTTIRNFTMVGTSTTPGVYQGGKEGAHGVLIEASNDTEIDHVTVRGVWGDCFYVGYWSDGVNIHDSTCQSAGRNGVTITSGRNVTIQHSAFDTSGYVTLDIEPNVSSEGATNVKFLNNTAGTWTDSFVSALGAAGSAVSGVTISGNTVTGKSMLVHITLARRQNITITNNRSNVTARGPVLQLAHIDGLTISGNVQPLSSGSLASIVDCTNVSGP